MSRTQEIPSSEWKHFFSCLSEEHDNEPVTIEVIGSEIGAQTEGRGLRWRGISQANRTETPDLEVMLDSSDGAHLSHLIPRASHIWLQQTEDANDAALEVESADGSKTLVRFATGRNQ